MESFGQISTGEETHLYVLENKNRMIATVSDYGATLVNLWVPDTHRYLMDVVCGYDKASDYETNSGFMGAVVGRVANRIGGASFTLDGKEYKLTANEGRNSLHGGRDFYNRRIWDVDEVENNRVTLKLHSPDGDQGYPGNVEIWVTYTLTDNNELQIHYHAVPDADTLINLTNHTYFNLRGQNTSYALDQELFINADSYTPMDDELIPTGEIASVEGTPMSFLHWRRIDRDADEVYEPLTKAGGYNHNYVLNGSGMRLVAGLRCDFTEVNMEVYTDLPGLQFYAGGNLHTTAGKKGITYEKNDAICLETQYFPDAIHHDNFESPIVRAGETYDTTTIYKFL